MKEKILKTVSDLVADFLYYDRKEDEELPKGSIEKAIHDGEITIDEIVERFKSELTL
ncbi:MAG: hypothetical protein V3V00_15750 [Saprospiraceae bacterium]